MKLSMSTYGAFTALMVLAACNGQDTQTAAQSGSRSLLAGQDDGVVPAGEGGSITTPSVPVPTADAGLPQADAAATNSPQADSGPSDGAATCGDGIVGVGEECDLGAANGGAACQPDCSLPPPPMGACLSCAQNNCPVQYGNALGVSSSSGNVAAVSQLFACVMGADWEGGAAIPPTSCFFADPAQPLGSLVPCYCGSTPLAECLASGPLDHDEGCGVEVEVASNCSPVSASCVTASGSNPNVPLGDALQLLNCERVACQAECGFPPPVEE